MKKISLSFAIAAASLAFVLPAAPAHAQASRTWVSGVGDDANPCSRTAPCKTFAGAISKTALNGEINCLDPGGFGAVTITKSITIDCHEVFASILNSGTNGINIPFDSFNAADVRKTVRLRNININGVDTGIIGIRITGGGVITAGVVIIEDCLIDGNFAGAAHGISDERTGGGELYISNTTVQECRLERHHHLSGAGAVAGPRIDAALDNVRVQNARRGRVHRQQRPGHDQPIGLLGQCPAGIAAAGHWLPMEVNISNSAISNNGTGVQTPAEPSPSGSPTTTSPSTARRSAAPPRPTATTASRATARSAPPRPRSARPRTRPAFSSATAKPLSRSSRYAVPTHMRHPAGLTRGSIHLRTSLSRSDGWPGQARQ